MSKEISISEATRKLPSLIHDVENGTSVRLTRRGRPVATVISLHEYQRLKRKKEGLWDAFMAFRQMPEKENIGVSDSDFENLRDKSPGREIQLL